MINELIRPRFIRPRFIQHSRLDSQLSRVKYTDAQGFAFVAHGVEGALEAGGDGGVGFSPQESDFVRAPEFGGERRGNAKAAPLAFDGGAGPARKLHDLAVRDDAEEMVMGAFGTRTGLGAGWNMQTEAAFQNGSLGSIHFFGNDFVVIGPKEFVLLGRPFTDRRILKGNFEFETHRFHRRARPPNFQGDDFVEIGSEKFDLAVGPPLNDRIVRRFSRIVCPAILAGGEDDGLSSFPNDGPGLGFLSGEFSRAPPKTRPFESNPFAAAAKLYADHGSPGPARDFFVRMISQQLLLVGSPFADDWIVVWDAQRFPFHRRGGDGTAD
jgi:hypothetical protein